MDGKCQAMDAMFMTVVSIHQNHKKSTFGWQKENGRKTMVTMKGHSTTNNIHTRRHFQVIYGM